MFEISRATERSRLEKIACARVTTVMEQCGLTDVGRRHLWTILQEGYKQRGLRSGGPAASFHEPDLIILDAGQPSRPDPNQTVRGAAIDQEPCGETHGSHFNAHFARGGNDVQPDVDHVWRKNSRGGHAGKFAEADAGLLQDQIVAEIDAPADECAGRLGADAWASNSSDVGGRGEISPDCADACHCGLVADLRPAIFMLAREPPGWSAAADAQPRHSARGPVTSDGHEAE